MAQFDHAIKQIAETTGRPPARIAGVECTEWALLESSLPATVEKLADRAFRASQGGASFVVYFEFYTTWDAAAPWDILGKSGMLSQREQLPTVCIVVVFQPKGYKSQNGRIQFYKQVFSEGVSETRRANIIRVLRSRFEIAKTDDLAAVLSSNSDLERLDALFDLALDRAGLDEFQAALAST